MKASLIGTLITALAGLGAITTHAGSPIGDTAQIAERTANHHRDPTPDLLERGPMKESPRAKSSRMRVVSAADPDRLHRGVLRASPRALANQVRVVPGLATPDRLDRGVLFASPRALANRVRIVPGTVPDQLDRSVHRVSPKAANTFPWLAARRR